MRLTADWEMNQRAEHFLPGQVWVVSDVDRQNRKVHLELVESGPEPEPEVSDEVRSWLAEVFKSFPVTRAHPELLFGSDRESLVGSARLMSEFAGTESGSAWWTQIPPEDDIPALVAAWRPPTRPDPRFVPA